MGKPTKAVEKEKFRKMIEQNAQISDAIWDKIAADIDIVRLKKGEKLISYSQNNPHVHIVTKGSLECSLITPSGNEKTVWFFLDEEFDIVYTADSYNDKTPTKYEITALEDTVLLRFIFETALVWLNYHPDLKYAFIRDLQYSYLTASEIRNHMVSLSSIEFINYLNVNYSFLFQRIPAKKLAQFMGITPEWFSKIKRSILN